MQTPVQVPPVPRYFMQPIVGRQWAPGAGQKSAAAGSTRQDRKSRTKAISNPCLIQLTTFAVLRLRPPFWSVIL